MTQTVNEGFFAEGVVLVEGDTETAALLAVANRLNSDLISKGIAIVPVGGKTTKLDRAAVVFTGLQIPTYIVFDADCRHKGREKESSTAATNRLLLRLCETEEEEFPTTKAGPKHACFEDDFEAYCRQAIGETEYARLRETASQTHGFDRPSDGIKNFEVVVELVDAIYDAGHKLDVLENIIDRVNELVMHINHSIDTAGIVSVEGSA